MLNIMYKELKLSASIISYLFIAFGLMFFLPGYPVLCGAFFVTLGIFKSYENMVETNDLVFSSLLPIAKKDVVKGKFLFTCFIELCSFILMILVVIIRSTILVNSEVYRNNALMNANCFALGIALIIFGLFNLVFITGFFKTTYKRMKPFVYYIIVAFLVIGIGEALHFIPRFTIVNSFGSDNLGIQLILLLVGLIIYLLLTFISYNKSCEEFEKIDL